MGVNQSPTRGKEMFPSSFCSAVGLHEIQKGHNAKGWGSLREAGGGWLIPMDISSSSKKCLNAKRWAWIDINHQMCSTLCLKWAPVACSLQLCSVGIAMPIYQMRKQTSEKWSDLLLFTQLTSSRAQIWPLTCLHSTFHSCYLTSLSSTPIQGITPTKEIDMRSFKPQDKLNQVSRREAL